MPVGDDARLLTALRESTDRRRARGRHELLGFLEIDWLRTDRRVIAVVVAPAPFKGALTAAAAARAIGAGRAAGGAGRRDRV